MKRVTGIIAICVLLAACASQPPQPTMVRLPPPPPSGEPPGLIGLSAGDVRTAFGTPTFVRKENGAEMWRYDGKDCRTFFFLYTKDSAQAVRHVETLPHGRDSAFDANCLGLLHDGQRPVS